MGDCLRDIARGARTSPRINPTVPTVDLEEIDINIVPFTPADSANNFISQIFSQLVADNFFEGEYRHESDESDEKDHEERDGNGYCRCEEL